MSNHMTEWIKLWLNREFEDIKCHVWSPYVPRMNYVVIDW